MNNLTIYIVEDEPDILEFLEITCEEIEANFHFFLSATEAISKMETHPPDIVLTDYNMPEMNGIEFLKKAKDYNSFMKMIILTGGSDLNATIEAIRLGVFDYILKPCPPERITLVLKNAQKMYSMERLNKELLKKLQSLASF